MNLRFVEAFVWVARMKSITRAAEKLCLTQSAVSSRITALEEEVGTPLLDRRDRVFRLTNAGTRFLDYAERFLALQRDVKREFGVPEALPLSLRIGGIETALHTFLIDVVRHLKARNPQIEFELTVEMTPLLNEQIRRGGLDLVFSAMPATGNGVFSEALPVMEMAFVGPADAAPAGPLSVDDLVAHDILTFQRGSQPHVALMDALRNAGVGHKHVQTISSISALVKLVESGFGLATLPRAAAEQLAAQHRIAVLDCELPLAPLPIFASFWSYPAAPALEAAIADAIVYARGRLG
ncbi:LysR family transcriptional regulator [Azospira restricta]|uniref:LysR family transcriptional regulator n=1 Tax=Azospira restricta TaxID=404405 RepID=A0A974PXQ6_9RHOO|nr:LysR family transcriptional regulator [Azospira restricta]QRJ63111.1 LysR family transcriptional regulator [Azospira restricta]